MAIAISAAFEKRLAITWQDVRNQKTSSRINIDPATTDTQITTFIGYLDLATNAKLTVDVETIQAVTGLKTTAADATEANLSEVMLIVLQAINPLTGSGKISGKVPIYAMQRSDEVFPAGNLNVADANIIGVMGFLNSHFTYKAPDASYHVGLLQVDPTSSQHITEQDEVDTV